MDFDAIEDRADVSTFDVPRETIGFLLGKSGITLRGMENKYSVFMFLDNDRQREGKHGPCKRLYVVGNGNDREAALDEAEEIVRFKLTGQSSGRGGPPRGPPPGAAYRSLAPTTAACRRAIGTTIVARRRATTTIATAAAVLVDGRRRRQIRPRAAAAVRRLRPPGPPPPRDDYYERRGPPPPLRRPLRRPPRPAAAAVRRQIRPRASARDYDDRRGPPRDDRCDLAPSPGACAPPAAPRAARHRYGERRPEYDRGPPPRRPAARLRAARLPRRRPGAARLPLPLMEVVELLRDVATHTGSLSRQRQLTSTHQAPTRLSR